MPKQKIYKHYKDIEMATNENVPYEQIEEMRKPLIEELGKDVYWEEMDKLQSLLDEIHSEKKIGIELEYGGVGTYCNSSHELVETIKRDGSVSGDGREFNLKPELMRRINSKEYRTSLESFMHTACNHNCTDSATAGNHVHISLAHFGEDTEALLSFGVASTFRRAMGDIIQNTNGDMINIFYRTYTKDEAHVETPAQTKRSYEAIQFLYSVSNRTGNEHYGLGYDGTRSFTRHQTTEIRCFRTSLDYRSIIARIKIAVFFVEWASRANLLTDRGYTTWEEVPSIWSDLFKNKEAYDMYTYLAFHCSNRHNVGLSEERLIQKLSVTKQFARAIKARSRMIQKALKKTTPENKAKELFKF